MHTIPEDLDLFLQSFDAVSKTSIDPSIFTELWSAQHQLIGIWLNHPQMAIQPPNLQTILDLVNQFEILVIWPDEWHRKKSILKNKLLIKLGHFQKHDARKMLVKKIDKKQANSFLETYHLLGAAKAEHHFALCNENNLFAVAAFSKPKTFIDATGKYSSYELVRLAFKENWVIRGGLSKIINHFCKVYSPGHLMTYIDPLQSSGKHWIQMGFQKDRLKDPIAFWVDKNFHRYYHLPTNSTLNCVELQNAGSIKLCKRFTENRLESFFPKNES